MSTGFQICPKCDGTGKRFNPLPETSAVAIMLNYAIMLPVPYKDKDGNLKLKGFKNVCEVCKGERVISTETGKPPID